MNRINREALFKALRSLPFRIMLGVAMLMLVIVVLMNFADKVNEDLSGAQCSNLTGLDFVECDMGDLDLSDYGNVRDFKDALERVADEEGTCNPADYPDHPFPCPQG